MINAGAAAADLDVAALLTQTAGDGVGVCHFTGSFPKGGAADLTRAGIMPSELGVMTGSCSTGAIAVPGYAIISIATA